MSFSHGQACTRRRPTLGYEPPKASRGAERAALLEPTLAFYRPSARRRMCSARRRSCRHQHDVPSSLRVAASARGRRATVHAFVAAQTATASREPEGLHVPEPTLGPPGTSTSEAIATRATWSGRSPDQVLAGPDSGSRVACPDVLASFGRRGMRQGEPDERGPQAAAARLPHQEPGSRDLEGRRALGVRRAQATHANRDQPARTDQTPVRRGGLVLRAGLRSTVRAAPALVGRRRCGRRRHVGGRHRSAARTSSRRTGRPSLMRTRRSARSTWMLPGRCPGGRNRTSRYKRYWCTSLLRPHVTRDTPTSCANSSTGAPGCERTTSTRSRTTTSGGPTTDRASRPPRARPLRHERERLGREAWRSDAVIRPSAGRG